jgi:hypothetical protein
MIMEMLGQPKEETKEEKLERTLQCYIKEMSAKEERIRKMKKDHQKEIDELKEKYETLERKYRRLKSRKA